jgi:hypothetical protein
MEALAAISLLGSIIQFADAGGKMIKMAHDIRKSSSGMTKENESVQELARQIPALSIRMEPSSTGYLSPDQYKDAKKELEQKLQSYRNLLQLQCNKMIRYS